MKCPSITKRRVTQADAANPFPSGTHGKAELQSCPWGWWDQQAVGRRADGRHPQDPSLSSALWVTMGTTGQEAELPEAAAGIPVSQHGA